jgi:hypothetical protein
MKLLAMAALAAGLTVSGAASAATITGLFNTGTDNANQALPLENGSLDTHYLIAATTDPTVTLGPSVTFANPLYVPDDADSRWISVSANGNPGNGTNTFEFSFSLAGLNAATASLSGDWGVDNEAEIFLNGVSTGFKLTGDVVGVVDNGDFASFESLHHFTINSGFQAGVNHLDFVVLDTGPPTALRVDNLAGTATAAVPEPASWALMIIGFGGVGAALRNRRRLQPAAA